MWKTFTAIILAPLGAYAGAQIAMAQADRSVLADGTLTGSDVSRIARYSTYGAFGAPVGTLILLSGVAALNDREWKHKLQNKGVAAVERLGLSGDAAVGVADALREIER